MRSMSDTAIAGAMLSCVEAWCYFKRTCVDERIIKSFIMSSLSYCKDFDRMEFWVRVKVPKKDGETTHKYITVSYSDEVGAIITDTEYRAYPRYAAGLRVMTQLSDSRITIAHMAEDGTLVLAINTVKELKKMVRAKMGKDGDGT